MFCRKFFQRNLKILFQILKISVKSCWWYPLIHFPLLCRQDKESLPTRDSLLSEHREKWVAVRKSWHEAERKNEERYKDSRLILDAIYNKWVTIFFSVFNYSIWWVVFSLNEIFFFFNQRNSVIVHTACVMLM